MNRRRQAFLLMVTVLFSVGVGVLIGSRTSHDGSSIGGTPETGGRSPFRQDTAESDQLSRALVSLDTALNEEIRERRVLAQQLEQLRYEVEDLQGNRSGANEDVLEARTFSSQAMEDRFTDMGFTPQDRESIGLLEASTRIRAIEIDDQARREGWINTSRYNEEMEALSTIDNPIRSALGDDRYDSYLYASQRPNRLVVGSIIETSPAQEAGLKRGDVILRYGGEPVRSNRQLVNLRSSGESGAPVIVEIVRAGQPMLITIPRGPMGFGGREESIDPRTNFWPGAD